MAPLLIDPQAGAEILGVMRISADPDQQRAEYAGAVRSDLDLAQSAPGTGAPIPPRKFRMVPMRDQRKPAAILFHMHHMTGTLAKTRAESAAGLVSGEFPCRTRQ